jgi:hypothetical protein
MATEDVDTLAMAMASDDVVAYYLLKSCGKLILLM